MSRSTSPLLALGLALASVVGCGPATHVGGDAGGSADAPSVDAAASCDPTRAPCHTTLRCTGLGRCEGLRLSDGEVREVEPAWGADVEAYLGRFIGLSTRGGEGFCWFGDSPGASTARFASLAEMGSSCTWVGISNVLCGVNTAGSFTPACMGEGVLVHDAAGVLYRVRVIADGRDGESTFFLELEWMATTP
ncbi:MAG: hypothetical protein U0353_35445 [Sandaracinus sp.]